LSTNLYVVLNALNNFDVAAAIKFRLDAEAIQGIIDPDLISVRITLKRRGISRRRPRQKRNARHAGYQQKESRCEVHFSPQLPLLENLADSLVLWVKRTTVREYRESTG